MGVRVFEAPGRRVSLSSYLGREGFLSNIGIKAACGDTSNNKGRALSIKAMSVVVSGGYGAERLSTVSLVFNVLRPKVQYIRISA